MSIDDNGLPSASSTDVDRPPRAFAGPELPIVNRAAIRERSDAARNRRLILAAAERLFASRGVANVTMDDVAAEAAVGKGTLYRRFGDKGGLAVALLSERERELQERLIAGPAPIGPGAPPSDRLAAFVQAYVRLVAAQLDLVIMSETSSPGARLRTGAHAFWRQHCRYLIQKSGNAQTDLCVDVILASLSAEMIQYQTQKVGHDIESLARDLATLAGKISGLSATDE